MKNPSPWITIFFALMTFPAHAENRFVIGGGIRDFLYKEDIAAPDKSEEHGLFPSFIGEYHWLPYGKAGVDLSVNFESIVMATSDYSGTELNSHAGISAKDTHTIVDFGFRASWPVLPTLSLFAGLTSHSWHRVLSYGSGYHEDYSWLYADLGARLLIVDNTAGRFYVSGSARPTFNGKIEVNFSDHVIDGENSTMDLGSTTGFRGSAEYEEDLTADWGLLVSLWLEGSSIGKSNSVYNGTDGLGGSGTSGATILEPASSTQQYGVSASFSHDF